MNKTKVIRIAKIFLLFSGIIAVFGFSSGKHPSITRAASDANISGYIWSENIGWIHLSDEVNGRYGLKMNFTDTNADGIYDRGVIDSTAPNPQKYAWSEYIGWVDFNVDSNSDTSTSGKVTYNGATQQLEGSARAISQASYNNPTYFTGQFDGWIKMSGTIVNRRWVCTLTPSPRCGIEVTNVGSYGPTREGCNFKGYAWGDNVVGWVNFKGSNYGFKFDPRTGCEIPTISNFNVSKDPIEDNTGADLTWTKATGVKYVTANVWVGGGDNGGNLEAGKVVTSPHTIKPPNQFGNSLDYKLKAINNFGDEAEATKTLQVRYKLNVTCNVQPNVVDNSQKLKVTATAVNGTPQATPGYQFILNPDGGSTIGNTSPTQNGDTYSWIIDYTNTVIGSKTPKVTVTSAGQTTGEVSCSTVANFGKRKFKEVSP